jgi:hypothetical protein
MVAMGIITPIPNNPILYDTGQYAIVKSKWLGMVLGRKERLLIKTRLPIEDIAYPYRRQSCFQ